jgi:predicted nucleic acid-binding protein
MTSVETELALVAVGAMLSPTTLFLSVLALVVGDRPMRTGLFGTRSAGALRRCIAEGSLVACDIVWAETGAWFPDAKAAANAFSKLRVDFSPLIAPTALAASRAWRMYREAGGTRERVIADFLIGAHAATQADRLLTRDRGFYRSHFRRLRVVDPTRP